MQILLQSLWYDNESSLTSNNFYPRRDNREQNPYEVQVGHYKKYTMRSDLFDVWKMLYPPTADAYYNPKWIRLFLLIF